MDLKNLSSLEESLLIAHVEAKRMESFLHTRALAQAASGNFEQVNKTLKQLRSSLFPDLDDAKDRSAAKTKKLLEQEFERGPMKIKALDYGRRKKRRR